MRAVAESVVACVAACLGCLLLVSHTTVTVTGQSPWPREFERTFPTDAIVTGLAVARNGDVIVSGITWNPAFPTTPDAVDRTCATELPCMVDRYDGFVTILTTAGELRYSTFIGPADNRVLVAPARDGSVWVVLDKTYANADPWAPTPCNRHQPVLLRLEPGAPRVVDLVCVGGPEADAVVAALAVAHDGSLWIAGNGQGIQTLRAWQPVEAGASDIFVAHYTGAPPRLLMATYVGGRSYDYASALTLMPDGDPVVIGATQSPDFPVVRPAQPAFGSGPDRYGAAEDAVVVRLDASGRWVDWSTWLGGSNWDVGCGIAVDGSGQVLAVGTTTSHDFPHARAAAPRAPSRDDADGFLVALDSDGQMRGSMLLGGTGVDGANHVIVPQAGRVLVFGSSNTPPLLVPGSFGHEGQAFLAWADLARGAVTLEAVPLTEPRFNGVAAVTSDAFYVYVAGPASRYVTDPYGWIWTTEFQVKKWHLEP